MTVLDSQLMTIAVWDTSQSPDAYTTITQVTSISGPSGSATVIDVSNLSSTAREKRLGLKDLGQISLNMQFDPTDTIHAQIRSDLGSNTSRQYQITFTDASPSITWTFSAYVNGFTMNNAVDGVTTADVTLEITGDITQA